VRCGGLTFSGRGGSSGSVSEGAQLGLEDGCLWGETWELRELVTSARV